MPFKTITHAITFACLLTTSLPSNAFFFFFPIPNLSKPPQLNSLIGALEKSEETKAVAYVSEDKTFGAKQWAWGHFSGHVPQAEADRIAMARCTTSLANSKVQSAGGKPLYDFGAKVCELYSFSNKNVSARAAEWKPESVATSQTLTTPPQPAGNAMPTNAAAAEISASVPTHVVSEPPPSPAAIEPKTSVSVQPAATESSTARRLRELESLRVEGLVSEAEYQTKRKAILAAM